MDSSLPGSSVCGIFPGKSTGVGCHCLLWQKVLILYKLSIWKGCDSMNENICTKVGTYSSINYSTFLNVLHSSTTWHRKWGFKVLSGNTPIEVASWYGFYAPFSKWTTPSWREKFASRTETEKVQDEAGNFILLKSKNVLIEVWGHAKAHWIRLQVAPDSQIRHNLSIKIKQQQQKTLTVLIITNWIK